MLKPDPNYRDRKTQGNQFLLDMKHPVKIEWSKKNLTCKR